MREVNCGKKVGEEAYPVTITIEKKLKIVPPLAKAEQTNTTFLGVVSTLLARILVPWYLMILYGRYD
ncbi:MAG: hypothetical protein JW878_06145 [Methanomicrobia archaeon]|nr:hypothetical protein [Methanomicrobia archaeon]